MSSLWLSLGGLTLVHFLWQGAVVAIVLALMLWSIPTRRADLRYGLALLGLVVLALCPVITFGWMVGQILPLVKTGAAASSTATLGSVKAFMYGGQVRTFQPRDALPYLVFVWGAGVAALSLRLLAGLLRVRKLTDKGQQPEAGWQERLTELALRFKLSKPIRLLMSHELDAPATTGVFRAVVILPWSVVAKMPVEAVEALLLHELAHIRRYDYLVNLLQTVVETVLFYHPAVWWVSHLVRTERENCCDDLAIRALGSDIRYAKALTLLEEHRMAMPMLAVPASGGHLMKRVQRILGLSSPQKLVSPTVPAALLVAALALTLGGTVMAQNPQPAPKPPVVKHGKSKRGNAPVAPAVAVQAPPAPVGLGPFGPAAIAPVAPVSATAPATKSPSPDAAQVAQTLSYVSPPAPLAKKGGDQTADSAAPLAPPQAMGGGIGGGGIGGGGGMGGGLGGGSTAPANPGVGGVGQGSMAPLQGYGASTTSAGFGGGSGQQMNTMALPVIVNSDGKVNVSFRNIELEMAVQMLAQSSKISVVLAPGNYERVTMTLNDQRADDALRTLARSGGAVVTYEDGISYLTPDRPAPMPEGGDLMLEDASFQRAALMLASRYGISISVPSEAKFGTVTAKLGDMPIEVALQVICESGGATYHVDRGVYYFVPKKGTN